MKPILLYDTTLRDGTQGENINFSAEDKIAVARRLDRFGIHYIEGGWPGSNPRDRLFFERARNISFQNAKLAAFGATRRPEISPEDDENLAALLDSQTPVVTVFGKSWTLHVEQVMENTLEENLSMIQDTVAYLKLKNREVIYDAEHFFDGYKADADYAVRTLSAALAGGAENLVLCDTNGGTLPHEIEHIIREVSRRLKDAPHAGGRTGFPVLGIHTHNDCGLAAANALAAVRAGVTLVQGTINGYGERCGNADLITLIPILAIKLGLPCIPQENMVQLKRLSRFVSETANIVPLNSRPFVGKSAFAHKGGIHVAAIMKTPRAYEHMDPERVGNNRRVLVSDLSGKSNIEYKARELGIELGGNGHDSRRIVSRIKDLEQEGYQFDAAEGSFRILVQKLTNQFHPFFELESFRVTIEKNRDAPCNAQATIKISVGGQEEITAAEGDGPVSALDNALRKALHKFFPQIHGMHLVDFKVRVIDGREGTASKVRVLIDSRNEDHIWSTIGVSKDIIEASWKALEDSFQYQLSNLNPAEENGV